MDPMSLNDQELKQAIKDTEDRLHTLREEQQTRVQALAESLLPAFKEKVRQYFGDSAGVTVETSTHDYDVYFDIVVPAFISFEDASKMDVQLFEDPEVLAKFLNGPLFASIRFAK
jgi:hypothetical protein